LQANNAVQHQIDYSARVGEFGLAQDRVRHRERDRAERARGAVGIQPKTVFVWLKYCGEGGIEPLIVRLLPSPELFVVLRHPPAEPERVEEPEDSTESHLEDAHREFHAGLKRKIGVYGSELLAGSRDVEYLVDDGVDERLFSTENPKDRTLGDSGCLRDLPSTDIAAEFFQQRLGRRDERCTALVGRKGCGPGHSPSLMSEHSLIKLEFNLVRSLGREQASGLAIKEDSALLDRLADRAFEAVLFDMDGTLIDSTPAVIRSWARWAAEHDVPPLQLAGWHGVPSANVVRGVLSPDRQEAAIARIQEIEIADLDGIVVLPGAAEALDVLRNVKTAIATSCTMPLARARIAASQLTPPSVLVTADDVARGKPAPDPYLEAARRLGVDPTSCLVVEDAPAGLESARVAGCATLAVVTTTAPEDLIADAVVKDLSEVRFDVTPARIQVKPAS
jgi:mannitol-1-/sugar-/sorbitol-6-phosphatase